MKINTFQDYVVNDYELVPEEIIMDSAGERSPLQHKNNETNIPSNEEVFTELISQRLAQGFQLILLTPQQEEAISLTTTSSTISSPVTPVTSSRTFASKLKLKRKNR